MWISTAIHICIPRTILILWVMSNYCYYFDLFFKWTIYECQENAMRRIFSPPHLVPLRINFNLPLSKSLQQLRISYTWFSNCISRNNKKLTEQNAISYLNLFREFNAMPMVKSFTSIICIFNKSMVEILDTIV